MHTFERLSLTPELQEKLTKIHTIFLDLDSCLSLPIEGNDYYSKVYIPKVVAALAEYYDVDFEKAKAIADYYHKNELGGGQDALFRGDAYKYPELGIEKVDDERAKLNPFAILHKHLSSIEPVKENYVDRSDIKALLGQLREMHIDVVLVTSSPDILTLKVLKASGLSYDDFDGVHAYEEKIGPLKILAKGKIFKILANVYNRGIDKETFPEMIAAGDTFSHDIEEALQLGMIGCLIGDDIDTLAQITTSDVGNLLYTIISLKK